MTVSILEARRPAEQRQLQAEMVRAWATMDQMDDASARRVLQRVAEMRADVLDRLAALPTAEIDGTETFASTSLRAFSAEIEDAANRFATRYGMDLGTDMRAMAAFSDEAHRTALSNLARSMDVPPALISFSPLGLADAQIEASVLFNNAAIKNVSQAVIQTVNRELQAVVFGGGSRWDAVRNIRSALATDGKNLGALTQRALTIERTGMVASFNIAAEHAYRQSVEELPDLLVEWMTATDKRVDPICVGLSGATKKPGGTFPGGYVAPPAHPRCRCRIVASLPGWKDLGKAAQESPALIAARQKSEQMQRELAAAALVDPGKYANLKEAEQGMHERYRNINFDFLGAHIDTINPSMRAFHSLAQDYPDVAARLEYIGVRPEKIGSNPPFTQSQYARAYAYATTDGKAIGLNRKWYGDPQGMIAQLARDAKAGFHPPGSDGIESVITHEFGHQVHALAKAHATDQILPAVWASGVGMRGNSLERWLDVKKNVAAKLSQYSKTNNEERFAELFEAARTPGAKALVVRQFRVLLQEVVRKPAIKTGRSNITFAGSLPDAERQAAIDAMKALAKRLGVSWP